MLRTPQIAIVAALTVLGTASAAARQGSLLSTAQANLVANSKAEQVKRCYFRHGLVEQAATGRVRLDLVVRSDGSVSRARVAAPGITRRAFADCVVARALTWKFPASSAVTEVRMPFHFRAPVRLRAR